MSGTSPPDSPEPYGNGDQDAVIIPPEVRMEVFMPVVQTLVNALGGLEQVEDDEGNTETIYRPGDSVLGVLKDLKKLWRQDDSDDERTVARCMAKAGLMKELIALVNECTPRGDWGRKVALMACDLIAALTWPIDVAKELQEMDEEGPTVTDYASLLRNQLVYKGYLIRGNTLQSVLMLMLPHFRKPRRDDKDDRIISLCLHIVRNMLAVKDLIAPDSATGDKEELSTLQSALIVQLEQLKFFELFVIFAKGAGRSQYNAFNTLILDILHLIYRGVRPHDLAVDQKKSSSKQLADMLANEDREKARARRHAGTRHSRFGTTITVMANKQRVVLHSQKAISTNPGTVLDENKKQRGQRKKQEDEVMQYAPLNTKAVVALQSFTIPFLETAFNGEDVIDTLTIDFMESILKDIRMDRSKIRPADSIRAMLIANFCMDYLVVRRQNLKAELSKKSEASSKSEPSSATTVDETLPLGMVSVMIELDSVRFVASRMKIAKEDKPPAWTELEASIKCFTQILLVLDQMASSTDKEDVEAAEILQNQIYYNGDILDECRKVISEYKNQAVGYLDSIVRFGYVLLRMLEKFSKNKAFMFIQKRAHKKKNLPRRKTETEAPIPEEYAYDEEEEGGVGSYEEDAPTYQEHAFKFTAFEKEFATEGVTNTLLAYLSRYRTFDDHMQFRRVVGLMHRQVVKVKAEGLYFSVTCLYLFQQILDDQHSLPKGDGTHDLLQLIKYVLRKFFKRLATDPFLMVDALAPKSRGAWKSISSYAPDQDEDRQVQNINVEFVKSKKLSWSQQVSVVVKLLRNDDKASWVELLLDELSQAHALRLQAQIEVDKNGSLDEDDEGIDMNEGAALHHLTRPSDEAIAKFTEHIFSLTEDQQRTPRYRLLLELVHFVPPGEDGNNQWALPASYTPQTIQEWKNVIQQFLDADPELEEDVSKYIRRARKRRVQVDIDSDGEEVPRAPRPRKQRKVEEMQSFKSAAFIYDTDDDEEADAAFFAREAELRARMEELGNTVQREGGTKKRKRKDKGKENASQPVDDSQASMEVASEDEPVPSQDEIHISSPAPTSTQPESDIGWHDESLEI